MKKLISAVLLLGLLATPIIAGFWDTVFRGLGYELMYLKMNDGKMLKYTSYNKATIDRTDFFKFIDNTGYSVSDIKVAIHNHPAVYVPGFSDGDKLFHKQIVKAGFEGKFQLYHRGKIYTLKE